MQTIQALKRRWEWCILVASWSCHFSSRSLLELDQALRSYQDGHLTGLIALRLDLRVGMHERPEVVQFIKEARVFDTTPSDFGEAFAHTLLLTGLAGRSQSRAPHRQ